MKLSFQFHTFGFTFHINQLPKTVMGVDIQQPRFSWRISHPERGQYQTKYKILVSQHPSFSGDDIFWDSGIVVTNRTNDIQYQGTTLKSDSTYFWKVTWWDSRNSQAPESEVARFDTGLFQDSDWSQSFWLGGNDVNMFRKEFTFNNEHFQRARVYIAVLGIFEIHLNGHKIANNKLDPGISNPNKRIQYVCHDITNFIVQGTNCISVLLGGGWFRQWYQQAPAFKLQISIDGNFLIVSNSEWKAFAGPIVSDSIYDGENYDARLERKGWAYAGFDDTFWQAATPIDITYTGKFSSQLVAPVQASHLLKPLSFKRITSGIYVFDFGQTITGWVRIRLQGTRGENVTLRYADVTTADGFLIRTSLKGAKARDSYVLDGDTNGEDYQPRFTYHGFRFVELGGFSGSVDLNTMEAIVVHSSVRRVGSFHSGIQVINQIQKMVEATTINNLMTLPTDCSDRDDRFTRLFHAHLNFEQSFYNYHMPSVWSHLLNLIVDDMSASGVVPAIIPFGVQPSSTYKNVDITDSAAFMLLAANLWKYYDTISYAKEHYESLQKWLDSERNDCRYDPGSRHIVYNQVK